MKVKSAFFCQECGYQSPKWLGKCPSCGQWNSIVEEVILKEEVKAGTWRSVKPTQEPSKPKRLEDILSNENFHRVVTSDGEFNRVLGGGVVPGSLIMIGGEPGIGKSTLMLQIAMQAGLGKILYVSGEESEYQIKMRAQRLNTTNPQCYLLAETAIQQVLSMLSHCNLRY